MTGWEIVCPDGKLRHFPYTNREDAVFDAGLYSRSKGPCPCDHQFFVAHGSCIGGVHEVRPVVFAPPTPRGEL